MILNEATKRAFKKRIETVFPSVKAIVNIYEGMGNFLQLAYGSGEMSSFSFDTQDFSKTFNQKQL